MALPIGDLNPTRRRSFVMGTFVLINLGVFAYQMFVLSGCEQLAFVYRFAVIPAEITGAGPLHPGDAAAILGDCAQPDKNIALSLLTTMFLHGGLAHLLGNLIYLVVFGDNVEDRLGHLRFVLFYVVGGSVATLTYIVLQPTATTPLVGASGAIAAVLGAYLICYPRAQVRALVPFPLYLLAIVLPGVRIRAWLLIVAIVTLPAWLLLIGWFAVQALAVVDPMGGLVAYEAHVAGFLAGIVLLLVLDAGRSRRGRTTFHPTRGRGRRRE
jgi:membrane associated rhomboid family serine protease